MCFLKETGSCGNGAYQLQIIVDSGEAVLPVVDQLKVFQIVSPARTRMITLEKLLFSIIDII